jgi:hypothetical protein
MNTDWSTLIISTGVIESTAWNGKEAEISQQRWERERWASNIIQNTTMIKEYKVLYHVLIIKGTLSKQVVGML